MSKGVSTCNRDARSESLVAAPKAAGDVSTKIGTAGFGCLRCKKRKTHCDPGLPRCRPCERVNVDCEYFDAITGEMKPRTYRVLFQNKPQAIEQGMFQSLLEGETVQLTDGSRSSGVTGSLTTGDQKLPEYPTYADLSFDPSVEAPGLSVEKDMFETIARRLDLNTEYDEGYFTKSIEDCYLTLLGQNEVETEAGVTEGPASNNCAGVERPQQRKIPSPEARQSSSTDSIKVNTQYRYTTESKDVSGLDTASIGTVPVDAALRLIGDLSSPGLDLRSSQSESSDPSYARAVNDYKARDRTSPKIGQGDIIKFPRQTASGWRDGTLNAARDMVPSNSCVMIAGSEKLTADDDPGDFCSGAYYLMEGQQFESLKVETRMQPKFGQSHIWTCAIPDCAFEGSACKVGGMRTLDDTVREFLGVRYRWCFLVKCHVSTETLSPKKQDSFSCILCIPENLPLTKYRSEDAFMMHVVNHSGQKLSWRAAQMINSICGRMALQGELFDINFPSPIRRVGAASGTAPLQRTDYVRLAPVTIPMTDAIMPVTNPGSNKNCQQSLSKTKKPFDEDGHVTRESNTMEHERRALVDDQESLRDTEGAAEAYQTPVVRPRTTTNTKQQSSSGRLAGRNFPFVPFSISSDTSSIYSGSTHSSSTYGSKDDSSMTSGEESQMETQQSINVTEHLATPRILQAKAKIDCKGDSAGMMFSLKPVHFSKNSESRVVAGSHHYQGNYARISGPETIPSHQLSSNPEDLQAASNTTVSKKVTYHKQGSLIKEDIAASGRRSSHAIGIILNPKPVGKEDCEIEQSGEALGHGETEDNIYSDIEPIAQSKKRANALARWLKEDRDPYFGFKRKPTKELRQPKPAEETQSKANDEKVPFHGDTKDYKPVILTNESATQHKCHDGLESIVRRPFWDSTFKHVFPLVVLVGTYFIEFYEVKYRKTTDHIHTMKENYHGCVSSVQLVAWNAVLWSSSKVLELNHKMLTSLHARRRNHAIEDSTSNMSKSLRTINGQEYTTFNSAKLYAENLTEMQWDWWPFVTSFRALQPDEVRVEWECELRHTHWLEIPRAKVHLMVGPSETTVPVKAVVPPSTSTFAGQSAASNSSSSSQISRSRSSDGRSSPATSDTGCSSPPSDNADCDDDGLSEQEKGPSGDFVAVDIVPPSKLNGYVLFGVPGSKRLRSSKTRLTQIDLDVCKDDDSFFDEMKVQYKELRGYLRWIFSIWVFHTCEFVMFFKANPNEIMPGPEEMPSVTDMDYRFATDRYPPILSSVFNASFYGCNKACIKSRLDVMSIFHECKGRNHCGKYRILERLPKRQRKWDIDRDEEKDEAWGLHATFGVSFYKVVVYHLLILVGPTTFWGVWLRRWPTDWQNASVPFFAVVVLLSLFWLPFAQNVGSKGEVKHKIA